MTKLFQKQENRILILCVIIDNNDSFVHSCSYIDTKIAVVAHDHDHGVLR